MVTKANLASRLILILAAAVAAALSLAALTAAAPVAATTELPVRASAPGMSAAPAAKAAHAARTSGAFNFGWKQAPASGNLSGISCLGGKDCMAVGTYTDLLGSHRSAAQAWNGSTWRVLGGVPGGGLSDVSCTRSTFCMAVGTVIDQWTGRSWKQLAEPGKAGTISLAGVSCTSATFCMAVGTTGGQGNVALAWNGRSWRSLTVPQNGCVPFCGLIKVACRSKTFCAAVGGTANNADTEDFSQGVVWNGKSWRETGTPTQAAVSSVLNGVSCVSTSSCVSVGNFTSDTPSCNCVLAAGWNGSVWTQITTPPVTGGLTGVSCTAAKSCLAVGGPLAMAWNGTAWTQQTIATPGEVSTSLADVACMTTSDCMAVGSYTESSGAQLTLAEHWNGTAWSVLRTFTQADPLSGLSGVSCNTATACTAVGAFVTRSDTLATLAERWNGRSWRVQPVPDPAGAKVSALTAVSCPAAAWCMTVGYTYSGGAQQAIAERWNGSRWALLPVVGSGWLAAVSCTSTTNCEAVGSVVAPNSRLALAARWNGSSWAVQTVPSPGATITQLSGVSCFGLQCTAVGDANSSLTSTQNPLTERWTGSAWQVQANPGGARQLGAVSCTRRLRCMAVGSNLAIHGPHLPTTTTALSWNGTSWSASRAVDPARFKRAWLSGISCASPRRCQAVGGYIGVTGLAFPLAESWDGAHWAKRPVAGPSPSFNSLYGISCPVFDRCLAVGVTGAQQTLAFTWNGTRWSLTKTANP